MGNLHGSRKRKMIIRGIFLLSPVGDNKLIILCHGVERYLYIIADVDADVEVGVEHYS